MFEKDSIVSGLLLGVLIPFVGFALFLELYDQLLENTDPNFRKRTSALLGICLNLIPFSIFNRKRFFNSMRGIMIPTVIYAFIWLFVFGIKIL